MLKYTKLVIRDTVDDVKLLYKTVTIATQVIYIAYLVAALIIPLGYPIANACLLPLSLGYFIFYLVSLYSERVKKNKTAKKKVKNYYTFLKNIIQVFVISASVYDIIVSEDGKYISVKMLLTALMIVMFILQISLQVVTKVVEKRFQLFAEALKADLEFITKPISEGKNIARIIKGEDPIKKDAPSETRLKLEKLYSDDTPEEKAEREVKADASYEMQKKIASRVRTLKSFLSPKKKSGEEDAPADNGNTDSEQSGKKPAMKP